MLYKYSKQKKDKVNDAVFNLMNKAWGSLLEIAHFSLSIILIRRDVNCKEKMSPAGSWYFKN